MHTFIAAVSQNHMKSRSKKVKGDERIGTN